MSTNSGAVQSFGLPGFFFLWDIFSGKAYCMADVLGAPVSGAMPY